MKRCSLHVPALMRLPPDLQYRLLRYADGEAETYDAMLTAEERARRASFRDGGRRRQFTLGRVAARTLLAERLGLPAAEVPLVLDATGAVRVDGAVEAVSIAHTGDLAVAVVGRRRVGADLETVRPRHPRLPGFLLHPAEHALIEQLPLPSDEALILVWTLKEATLKALRTGFRLSPKKLQVTAAANGEARVCVEGEAAWEVRYRRAGGAYLALAFRDG